MKQRAITLENLVFLLALIIAAGVRFLALGRLPLSDAEAGLALQSLELARGNDILITSQPGYVTFTAIGFNLFGAGNFMARFWPALSGSLLAAVPLLFRRLLGRRAALLLAFFIALDPGLVAISRTADGLALGVTCLAFAAGFALNRRYLAAGALSGLALIGGPALWPGVISIALAGWAAGGLRALLGEINALDMPHQSRQPVGRFFAALAAAVVLAGTLFFLAPSGLSAAAADIPAYLAGWSAGGGTWFFLPVLAILFYEPQALLLGLWGGLTGLLDKDPLDRFLGLWALLAFVLALVYPAREVSGLAWALLPLLALAARQSVRLLARRVVDGLPSLAQALLAVVLLGFAWMNLVTWFNTTADLDPLIRLAAILGAFILLTLTAVLMGMGWSWQAARQGLSWGVGLVLILFTLSMTWRAAGLGARPQIEMWRAGPAVVDADLILQTVHDLSMFNTGEPQVMEVAAVGVESPALRWLLRDQREASYLQTLPTAAQPPLVITPLQESLSLASGYRGQDFVWMQTPPWSTLREQEWARWLVGRAAPLESSTVLLWARTDLFAGETVQPAAPEVP